MNICTNPHIASLVIALGVAAHSVTLFVDYWMGVTEKIEHNSIVEFILSKLKKDKAPEVKDGK